MTTTGRPQSPESNRKRSETQKGRPLSPAHIAAVRASRSAGEKKRHESVPYSRVTVSKITRAMVAARPRPWLCMFCGGEVFELGKSAHYGVAHHKDSNPQNNSEDNVGIAHGGCHVRYHTFARSTVEKDKQPGPVTLRHHAKLDHVPRLRKDGRCKECVRIRGEQKRERQRAISREQAHDLLMDYGARQAELATERAGERD